MKNKKSLSILILLLLMLMTFTACGKPSEEKIKNKMEQELLAEYGEPFVVENIGLRSANGVKFYQAQIYPKSIIGTPKENDKYYYSTASVDVSRMNNPNSVGNSYGVIKMNDEAEEYLLPKAKELFGDRIRIKADIKYKVKQEDDFYSQYLVAGFEEKRKEALANPETQRFEVTLYLYIFDKIDNEKEKEDRRKEIFEFIQYLKKEGLFEYAVLDVLVIDEKVLASSYEKYKTDLEYGETIKEIVDGEEIYLPPKDLRREVISVLGDEVKNMTEEDILKNIHKIMKSELTDETYYTSGGIAKKNTQMYSLVYSQKLVQEEYKTAYEQGEIKISSYEKIDDIEFKRYYKYSY